MCNLTILKACCTYSLHIHMTYVHSFKLQCYNIRAVAWTRGTCRKHCLIVRCYQNIYFFVRVYYNILFNWEQWLPEITRTSLVTFWKFSQWRLYILVRWTHNNQLVHPQTNVLNSKCTLTILYIVYRMLLRSSEYCVS